jgi:chromosome segregation ATPase
LEKARGELAATSIKMDNCKAELDQLKATLNIKDNELIRMKNQIEMNDQNLARTSAMLQSSKKQIKSLEQDGRREKVSCAELENQSGQLKKQIKDKEALIQSFKEQLHQMKIEREEMEERATVADMAYEEICYQLSEKLQIEHACDSDDMLDKISSLLIENNELHQKNNTLSHSLQAVDLDAKASR